MRRAPFFVIFAVLASLTSARAEDRVFGTTGPRGFTYYESSVSKFIKNGEVFFGVTGYAVQSGVKEKIPFKALFNCGNKSRIARQQFYDRSAWDIADRVKYVGRSDGVWYSLQAEHCPNNHFEFDSTELWK